MGRLTATLLVLAVLVLVMAFSGSQVEAFSLGRLFPASRRGVRGSALIGSSSPPKVTSNALVEAVRQAVSGKTTTTTTTTTTPKPEVKKPQYAVTNSPIYYIRLPPSPYVYMPGLGYVSPSNNNFSFLRPDVNFINNGKPSSVYHYMPTTTTTTTTSTTTTTPRPTTTTTPPPPSTTAISTTTKPHKPTPTKKPSPITWLQGPWFFNGRPSNLFIFRSPYDPSHFDKLHQRYNKPGIYLK